MMQVPPKKLQIIRRAMKACSTSAQAPLDDDGHVVDFAEMFEDYRMERPEHGVAELEEFDTLLKLIDAIDERDAKVLRLRFGLEGKEPLTLKQIGKEVGLTRERVRQIEVDALKKLQAQLRDDRPSRFFRQANGEPSQANGRHRRAKAG